jgi:lysophospholipase L1-like esterase
MFFRDHPNNQKRELIMPGGHPNEKGHIIVADMLQSEIDRVILSK